MSLPTIPSSFEWIEEPWGTALRCTPLASIAPHLFTTRQLALSSPDDWRRLGESLGAAPVRTLTQVHGRNVAIVRKGRGPSDAADARPEADAFVSDDPAVAVAVRAADCVPVLIADRERGVVAAIHAGWRGTAARAVTAAVDALEQEFGSHRSDLVAAIGPSIGPCCYEVGSELVDAFAAAGHARHLIDRWFLAAPPGRGAFERGKLRLDTWGANRDQLLLAGVEEQNVHSCGLCTAEHLDLFPSYRAEKERAGRLAGAIRARG